MALDFEKRWEALADEVITGMAEWRLKHPKATFREIEDALDERLDRLRSRMLSDAAMASEATDWTEAPPEAWPLCPECGARLQPRSRQERRLQSQGAEPVVLKRTQGTCSQCGASLFPPG